MTLPFGYIQGVNADRGHSWLVISGLNIRLPVLYGSGMSTFCLRFLQKLDTLCTEPDFSGGIIWCYNEQCRASPKVDRAKEERTGSRGSARKFWKRTGPTVPLYSWRPFKRGVFTSRMWHVYQRNFSVILITPNVFHQATHCRDISLNAKYLVVWKRIAIGTSLHTSRGTCFLKLVLVCVKRIERQPRIPTFIWF
jgi:hypothetical protein